MKRILVPIDFSNEAKCAAKIASKIVRKTGGELFLLHMLELPTTTIDPTDINGTYGAPGALFYLKIAQKKFAEFKKLPFLKGVKIIETIQFFKAFDGIIDESKKHDVNLIVMGSKGTSGLHEMFIGSNTEKVVRKSHVPVLVVKKGADDFKIKDIVFASDFSPECKSRFQDLIEFAAIFNAKLHLLYINTIYNFENTKATENKINSFLKGFKLSDFTINIYNDVSIETGILNYSREIDADIICITTHGRSGLSQLFNGSIGEELSNHALKPVLTFKL